MKIYFVDYTSLQQLKIHILLPHHDNKVPRARTDG